MIALLKYDDDTEKCVGCDLCEAACPSRVITVISSEVEGEPMKRYAKEYYMDMTRCLFCGLCVQACQDRKSTRLNSSHSQISYAVFCLKKKNPCSLASSCPRATRRSTARD